jgi:hypothetical protein
VIFNRIMFGFTSVGHCSLKKKPERKRELDSRCSLKGRKKEDDQRSRRTTIVRRTRPPRPQATHAITLSPLQEQCEQCAQPLWVAYHGHRTVTKLDGLWQLTIVVRRCIQPKCPRYHVAYRPEEEGGWALPHGEFGLEVIALMVGGAFASTAVCQRCIACC